MLLSVLWAAPLTNARGETPPDGAAADIDTFMHALHDRGQFDGALLVAREGRVIYRGALGIADPKTGEAFTPRTPSCLASVSKPFTAVAIMMLAEKGGLTYDDSIAKYIPGLAPGLGVLTIRQLLTHTSGVPDYSSDLGIDHPGITLAEVMQALRGVRAPLFPPGEKYRYSNTGYVLLGVIVEKLAGKPLPEFLKDTVFEPLDMESTFALMSGSGEASGIAHGSDDFGSPDEASAYLGGEGGLFSTVDDLFKFDQALYESKLVQVQTLAEAFTPPKVRSGQTTYGFGWNVAADDLGGKRVWHTGNTAGYRAFIERRLGSRTTIIMLTNHGSTKRVEINEALQNILAGKPPVFPKRSIAVAMHGTILSHGVDAGIAQYRTAKAASSGEYDVGEGELNMLGYQLLYRDGRHQDGVRVFVLNTAEHPDSSNAYDSLAEAYGVVGDAASAKRNYRIAIDKDPANLHASEMLKKLP
jgi:CubicO group peptidase (beta-lactamase class C family)